MKVTIEIPNRWMKCDSHVFPQQTMICKECDMPADMRALVRYAKEKSTEAHEK